MKTVIKALFVDGDKPVETSIRRKSMKVLAEINETTELQTLLSENYYIPRNSGSLPGAEYNDELDVVKGESALETWIYPASKTFRTYQFKIVRSCLFENTLVTLPTGLGKTFIASTVMFNFWRWFKNGLIFFVAPTKPLVAQQV